LTACHAGNTIAASEMAKEVRYTTTSDGIQIGYAVSGSGPTLVSMPDIGFGSMLLSERDLPEVGAWAEALSRRFTYVRYDARGYGFSQNAVPDLSLATWAFDLDAVVNALNLERFALIGWLGSSRVAVAYAAEHPDQVARVVVLPCDYPVMSSPEGASLEELASEHWETFTETLAHVAMGWERGDLAQALSAHWRASVTRETYQQFLDQFTWPTVEDLAALRGRFKAPVLVVARRHKYLGERIPVMSAALDARVVLLPGADAMPYIGDTARVIEVIHRFVEQGDALESEDLQAEEVQRDVLDGGQLTQREREVLGLLAAGKSNAEIAEELVLSVRTVERHLMRIYDKFGVSGKTARVVAAAHAILQTP
jgi:pimeloyl-ACP methyl ester carboxylesterase/DNA-binding CsgD family transcriptional regulator